MDVALDNKHPDLQKIFSVTDTEILIDPAYIRNGLLQNEKELFYDFFASKYCGQQIVISALDGENLKVCGLFDMLESLCQHNIVPRDKILFRTYDTHFSENFPHRLLPPGLMWTLREPQGDFSTLNADAKFVGITIGRFTPGRFRMVYELHQAFETDTFSIFNPPMETCKKFFYRADDSYLKELSWFEKHQFNKDEYVVYNNIHNADPPQEIVEETLKSYSTIWPEFKIEIVAETDVLGSHWFTEKTGRCLITGKPFLLLGGQHSLKRVKEMGFVTFDQVIDESYDDEFIPVRRIAKMIESLRELYNSPDREEKIQQLYNIADRNKKIYPKLRKFYQSRNNDNSKI